MRSFFTSGILLLSLFLGSCKQRSSDPYAGAAPLYTPKYAQGFALKEKGNERVLYIKKSWQGGDRSDFTYLLYPRKDSLLYKGKPGYIPYPVKKAVCLSTTHIAYLSALGEEACISGVSGAQYVSNPHIRKAIELENIKDVGYEGALNYETLLALHPDVVFAYGVAGESTAFLDPLIRMGVQVVYVGDYLETHPLGKAEYLLAFSAFFDSGVIEKASEQFAEICDQYNSLKALTEHNDTLAKVLMNAPFKDAWYLPGENNYMSRLLRDAGALILGSREGVKESHTISLEQAWLYATEADFWLHPNAYRTLNALSESDPRFAQIPAFKAERVYNNTRRDTPGGGSDFWETGVTEPHVILADLMSIFHPKKLPGHQLVYYERLTH